MSGNNSMCFFRLIYLIFCVVFLLANLTWANSFGVELLTERHRTEWNWVNYRLTLINLSNSTLENPSIRYFAENPRIQYCNANVSDSTCVNDVSYHYRADSSLTAAVDYVSNGNIVSLQYNYNSGHTVITLAVLGSIQSLDSLNIHFRVMKKDWSAWDCSHDYSYQLNASAQEPNYKMAVYDGNGDLLWGYDPVALKHDSRNVYWYDRSSMKMVSRYDELDSSKTFNGRFWMFLDTPLSIEERLALKRIGARLLESSRYQRRGLHLLRALVPIDKKTLNANISSFFNAIDVDDTTDLVLEMPRRDSDTTGHSIFDLEIMCWPDLEIESCKTIVVNCGGEDAYIDRSVVLANVRRDSIQCLEKHNDVRHLQVQRQGMPTLNDGRQMIHLAELQIGTKWQQALQAQYVTKEWLSDADYTGEGVIVGVYDTGIDFTHPGFNERNSDGVLVPRKAVGYNDGRTVANGGINITDVNMSGYHGTHVAGIIGGNGSDSSSYAYRGVAPKVNFLSDKMTFYRQKGHVVNHSHVDIDSVNHNAVSYYNSRMMSLDENIFNNWKEGAENGDNFSKAVIVVAGNNGTEPQYGKPKGYHSILVHSKNSIAVGAINKNFELANFSSMGPLWDGLIKPDIMAPGVGITSSIPYSWIGKDKYYYPSQGTSMAAPFVSGIAALMYQKFHKLTGESLETLSMRNSSVKAMLIHGAKDMNGCSDINMDIFAADSDTCTPYTQGPDFASGWGYVDARTSLDIIDNYNVNTKSFARFREFEISNGAQRRWTISVPAGQHSLRTTLVWDDAAGDNTLENYMESKLVNDLDLYLISPSGRIYYPWRLDPLPTENIRDDGTSVGDERLISRDWGLERITFADASRPAYRHCLSIYSVSDDCFDRINNVEVVDVDNPEPGVWQVVCKGYRIETGNNIDSTAQVASIVSDYPLMAALDNGKHPYDANVRMSETYDLGDNLENYVTFGTATSLGAGDTIYLYDSWNRLIGSYTGNSLAGKRITVKSRYLKIVLDSNNDNSQGWGYSIAKIEHLSYGVLQTLFPPYKKRE
ncbi:MAG: S8 family serine peptidase [Fibrobacter sp.]|nr:S8 family serine peptidase [Fibrobacter sp.]